MIQAPTILQWAKRGYALLLILGVTTWAFVACLVIASPLILALAVRR